MYRILETRNPGHPRKVVAQYAADEASVALTDWQDWLTIADHCHSLIELEHRQGDCAQWETRITYNQLSDKPCGD